MNVDQYLARIGYTGSREPTLSTLKELSYCHRTTVLFTNLEMFGGKRITLELEKLFEKIVTNKEGGICMEINGLFLWLLHQFGFEAYLIQSRYLVQGEFTHEFTHPVPVVDLGENGKYLVDPGYSPISPMKLESMTPHVEMHNVFRCRPVPDEENWFYLERHKKTVLDADGKVLKQGPAPPGLINGMLNEESKMIASDRWVIESKFCLQPQKLDDFTESCARLQDDKNSFMKNMLAFMNYYNQGKVTKLVMGTTYSHKEHVDPLTDKILATKEITSDEEIPALAEDILQYKIQHEVKFFNRGK